MSGSWSDFSIHEDILTSLKEHNLDEPLPIQIKALKATLIQDKHVLGAARTGSGKTLAYAIPLVNRILSNLDKPCSMLKRAISKKQRKKEDFELIDGEMVAVEDMIVDKDELVDDDVSVASLESEGSDTESDINLYSSPEGIVLVPTRELAMQVKDEIDKICKHTEINTCCLIGGLCQDKQLRNLRKMKPQIIIATPGRLYDIVQSDEVEHLNHYSIASIRTLVIDEADRMVQKGHFEEMLKIIDIIKAFKKFREDAYSYRVYLFSATLTFLHELPQRFIVRLATKKESRSTNKKNKNKPLVDPKEHNKTNKINQMLKLLGIAREETRIIDLNDESSFGRPSCDQLTELKINCLAKEKDLFLYYFLVQNPNKRTIVFCNSKDCLRRLTNVLKFLGVSTLGLHADMDQKKRLSSLEKFRARADSVLIATDVAARGLDIKDLDCVIHYQVPKTCESYIHRSGRTARLSKKGTSLTLCEPKEAPFYKRLCNSINGGKDLEDYDVDLKLKNILKDRVVLAQQCDTIDHQLRETKSDRNWFVKAAKDCDIELEEEDIRQLSGRGKTQEQNVQDDAIKRRKLSVLQKQLNKLQKKPLMTRASMVKQSAEMLDRCSSSQQ